MSNACGKKLKHRIRMNNVYMNIYCDTNIPRYKYGVLNKEAHHVIPKDCTPEIIYFGSCYMFRWIRNIYDEGAKTCPKRNRKYHLTKTLVCYNFYDLGFSKAENELLDNYPPLKCEKDSDFPEHTTRGVIDF